jgi:predicted short-subunit dehydrogenase-like oxidoreductase (DUF2520 family)
MEEQSIAIIGSGNVASHLLEEFHTHQLSVVELYSRNKKEAAHLCDKFSIKCIENLEDIKGRIIFICVNDSSIEDIASHFVLRNKILVHTSGSTSIEIFKNTDSGVFYPLQTIIKGRKLDFRKVPIYITASNSKVENVLMYIGNKISEEVQILSDEQRLHLHLMAVMTNNFINHLAIEAKSHLENLGMSYDLLLPLLNETFKNLSQKPFKMEQTGPAQRGDLKTIDKHISLLSSDPNLQNIYQSITKSIIDKKIYNENNKGNQ